jgi:hypothetical protein
MGHLRPGSGERGDGRGVRLARGRDAADRELRRDGSIAASSVGDSSQLIVFACDMRPGVRRAGLPRLSGGADAGPRRRSAAPP